VLGSLILLYVGIKIFVDARKSSKIDTPDLANSPTSRASTYAKFFGLTVLNPATAFYFFGISPSVAVLSQGTGFMSIAYFAVGVFLGSIVWQLSLVVAANLTKALTSAKIQHRIQYAGALLIVALAIGLILK
jgi:threonine/homoserine/homoserine lactone efflux protein